MDSEIKRFIARRAIRTWLIECGREKLRCEGWGRERGAALTS